MAPRTLPFRGYGGVIDSSVLVIRTRESILTVFFGEETLGRSTQAGMLRIELEDDYPFHGT